MGRTYSTYFGEERCIQGFWWGNLKERDNLKDPGIDAGQYQNGSTGSGLGAGTGLIWPRIDTGAGLL